MSEEEEDDQRHPEKMKAKKAVDSNMVRMKPSTLTRLKTFKTSSDSVNNIIEEMMNYYEANNSFLHNVIERFEEDMLSIGRIESIFPYSQNLDPENLTIYRLYRFIKGKFSNVTFVKYECSNQMVGGSPNYVFVFYTENRNIRRPFFMIKTCVDKMSGYIPLGPEEKIKSSDEDFVGWMPLFEAFEKDFKLHKYITGDYLKSSGHENLPENPEDNERFILNKINQRYEKSRGN